MIDVIEVIGPDGTPIPGVTVPPEIAACGPGAPVYLVIDPSQGTPLTRAQVEEEVRRNYKRGASIIFSGHHTLSDGRIVHVGQKIDPLVANLF